MKDTLLRLPAVKAAVSLSRTSLYDLMKAGDFPAPIRLGARTVAWKASAIQDWIDSRPSARGGE